MQDLFSKPSQKDLIYEFIKSRGRVPTHELILFGVNNYINNAKERARDLKKEGKVWRIREDLRKIFYPNSKEEYWSIYPADKGGI